MIKDNKILFFESITEKSIIPPNFYFVFDKETYNELIEYKRNNFNYNSKELPICYEIKDEGYYINVKNPNVFFDKIGKYFEKVSELYDNKRTDIVLSYLWLRVTAEDLNDIESFLDKQLQIANNSLLNFYSSEQEIGNIPFLHNRILTAKSTLAKPYDESIYQMEFNLYSKLDKVDAVLPVVRYGIYEKDGKKICGVYSVQSKSNDKNKQVERDKYKVNDQITEDSDMYQTEPKKLISLFAFVALMLENGITDFEVNVFNTLDYAYHQILSNELHDKFLTMYPNGKKPEDPNNKYAQDYDYFKEYHDRYYQKQDEIIQRKIDGIIKLTMRLLYHYSNGEIKAYPFDVDSNFHFTISGIDETAIRGKYLHEISDEINSLKNQPSYNIQDILNESTDSYIDINKLNELSKRKNSNASCILGIIYEFGLFGIEKNKKISDHYYCRGKALNDLKCMYLLSNSYNEKSKYIEQIYNSLDVADEVGTILNKILIFMHIVRLNDCYEEVLKDVKESNNRIIEQIAIPMIAEANFRRKKETEKFRKRRMI